MNDIYSFYQLISKFQIEIPVIQRDYAQGRKNPKAKDVRKSMVRSMVKSVTEDDSPLFFDFVYGRIDDNKFIPFDGQQRLTTLFLFHKYVFEKCQSCSDCYYKTNCICKDILLRFTYATRQSSREFCEQLVSKNVIPSEDDYKRIRDEYLKTLKVKQKTEAGIEKKADEYVSAKTDWISGFVKNQSWFYSDWEKDPTIMGMLTMLDEIHNQLQAKNINNYKPLSEKLTSGCSCPITFHFVDMGEHKLSDETYVKMNARGKTLTPFENFKASLEQYLENNSDEKDSNLNENERKSCAKLLKRFKGVYDSKRNYYTGVDGIWLDLFWDVVNKEKEQKELPDDAMMSFFNRHFMNVWRCWYGNQEKHELDPDATKALKSFNDRIIKEMPLHPKKDDFVSWDIYQYVLDNCGIDECLTPIFNIWDEVCIENNCVERDCQAVWNRGTGKDKWNLYVGEKKNNRETYPSRVAFYALLRYYGVESHKTSLAQWMRIVWNIIENSTLDSPGTYQAALRLINKLSEKCYDIHDALANHFADFQLGSQYHAQDQVQEEVVKAKQILNVTLRTDGKSWEEIITEAESYAFFKGAIRFLFTDGEGNINWCGFNPKWANAREYFDEAGSGVKDGIDNDKLYKSNALLMKSLLANCDDFWGKIWWHFEFANDATRWKRILISDKWRNAVDVIMGTGVSAETTQKSVEIVTEPLIMNLVDDELMDYVCNNMSGAWIRRTYHDYLAIWQSGYPSSQIVLNPILVQLKNDGTIDYRDNNRIKNCRYYKCVNKNVDFKYNNHPFRWYGYPNEKELDIYLMGDNWAGYKKRQNPTNDKGTEEDTHFCFRVDENTTPESFTGMLDDLIAQAEADKQAL